MCSSTRSFIRSHVPFDSANFSHIETIRLKDDVVDLFQQSSPCRMSRPSLRKKDLDQPLSTSRRVRLVVSGRAPLTDDWSQNLVLETVVSPVLTELLSVS